VIIYTPQDLAQDQVTCTGSWFSESGAQYVLYFKEITLVNWQVF